MDELNFALHLASKHRFTDYTEVTSCSLRSIELKSPVAKYTLHVPFTSSSFQFEQEEDGFLRLIVEAEDIDEDAFFELNGYLLEQADFASFITNEGMLNSFHVEDIHFQSEIHTGELTGDQFQWHSLSMKWIANTVVSTTIKSAA